MSIRQYYELETILEAIDSSKEKFIDKPYVSADSDNEEMLLIIDSFLASFMREILRKNSEFIDLDALKAIDGKEEKVEEGGEKK